jgi:hypothetical protein
MHSARALSTKQTVSANTTLLRATATRDPHIHTNRLLATATALTVCAMTMKTMIPMLSPLPMTQHPLPFMPSPRPSAAALRLQARAR